MLLEICCYNLESALIAQRAGAHRVELCADPSDGGTTPAFGLIKTARKKLHIPLYPIIRARGGDFLFSEEEFEIMRNDVVLCKKSGCDGVVIGILQSNGKVDKARCLQLTELAYPMGVTFHRAFDWAINPFEALEDVIDIGCERILSSGQQPNAIQGTSLLADLVKQADHRITIMPGGGVRSINIADLGRQTHCTEFHSSASIRRKGNMEYLNHAMQEEPFVVMADEMEIKAMLAQLSAPLSFQPPDGE